MAKDVFISYSNHNRALADKLCMTFEEVGLNCWIAPRDIPAGAEFEVAILDGIDQCQAIVVVLTPEANASVYVKAEINRAFSQGKPILTFRAEDIKPAKALEFYLARMQWTDGFPPPVEERVARLGRALLELLGRTPLPSTPTDDLPQLPPTTPVPPRIQTPRAKWNLDDPLAARQISLRPNEVHGETFSLSQATFGYSMENFKNPRVLNYGRAVEGSFLMHLRCGTGPAYYAILPPTTFDALCALDVAGTLREHHLANLEGTLERFPVCDIANETVLLLVSKATVQRNESSH